MKRWIHASIDEDYTDFISEELPTAVADFMVADEVDYPLTRSAVEAFDKEYKMFPSGNTMDSLDMKYDEDKRRFYKKYRPFADRCKELYNEISPSGYGIGDYAQLKIKDILRYIDYNFPYGWKHC